ncbi:hypothetical protein D7B24_005241 [Verticillium nonalfalfae]|uniref:Asl1-like glycosyl hydrolase catalytic domain-containing protein n=1 Tax=Verticillium nonalfalfae TaxID=1051616 RepID=A0A3M9YE82_9PEZI|nr:uncharacterized protein D7B24_005241 [Verticillium nonalfalfae]RNJ58096.1 hypothetical protein D7B24_005241 [Verticillium nonalfalfae]
MIARAVGLLALLPLLPLSTAQSSSNKRGLCFIAETDFPSDHKIWMQDGSDISWYYNYGFRPSPTFADYTQEQLEYVPMMWGVDHKDLNKTEFKDAVIRMIDDEGRNITRVLGFNEPDMGFQYGGSDTPPALAARAWVANFIPLQERGIKVGLPAMTGQPYGLQWLHQFLGNCSDFISVGEDTKKNCTYDFLPVHWYDNFEGLASHIGERIENFPNTSIWVTEYAYAHQDLQPTEQFYNTTSDYFERVPDIGLYSYYGAFRSAASNVGPNVPFLNNAGELTDIGSWYLGVQAKGVKPQSAAGVARVSLGMMAASVVPAMWLLGA